MSSAPRSPCRPSPLPFQHPYSLISPRSSCRPGRPRRRHCHHHHHHPHRYLAPVSLKWIRFHELATRPATNRDPPKKRGASFRSTAPTVRSWRTPFPNVHPHTPNADFPSPTSEAVASRQKPPPPPCLIPIRGNGFPSVASTLSWIAGIVQDGAGRNCLTARSEVMRMRISKVSASAPTNGPESESSSSVGVKRRKCNLPETRKLELAPSSIQNS